MNNADAVSQVLEEVLRLQAEIDSLGKLEQQEAARIDAHSLVATLPLQKDELDAAAWAQLSDTEQTRLYRELETKRNLLRAARGSDGPSDVHHVMHFAYASTRWVIMAALASMTLVFLLLFRIVQLWPAATGSTQPAADLNSILAEAHAAVRTQEDIEHRQKALARRTARARPPTNAADAEAADAGAPASPAQLPRASDAVPGKTAALDKEAALARFEAGLKVEQLREALAPRTTERAVLVMVLYLGALGGTLHAVASLMWFIGNRSLRRSWLLFYLSLPFRGAALAALIYMLLRVGLLAPNSAGGTSTSNLNLIGIYAIAALAGMFSEKATDKLAEVFSTMFQTQATSKDKVTVQPP